MRILHLSTSTLGGAGVVASRLAELQRYDDHEVLLITLNNIGYEKSYLKKRKKHVEFVSRVNTKISMFDTRDRWGQLTSMSVSAEIMSEIEAFSPDVIHVHNWFNLLNVRELGALMSKFACVFHIHDARLITGGCHYTLDCFNYQIGCVKCPATHLKRSLVSLSLRQIEIQFSKKLGYGLIFPSNWLMRDFNGSKVSQNASVISKITNPIDVRFIESLELPKSSNIKITCVISDLSAIVKGFDLFLDGIELLRRRHPNLVVQAVGGNPTSSQIQRAKAASVDLLGRLSNRETLKIVGESHLLVVPSLSENAPTVILEAQALGTCVLVTDIDGCRELVVDGTTGFVCDPTGPGFFKGIERALSSDAKSIIEHTAKMKSTSDSKDEMSRLYNTYLEVREAHQNSLNS